MISDFDYSIIKGRCVESCFLVEREKSVLKITPIETELVN
jgi:hypothetical protein